MKLQIVAAMVAMAVTSVAEAAEYVLQNDAVANAAAWSSDGGATKVTPDQAPAGSTFRVVNSLTLSVPSSYEMPGRLIVGADAASAYGKSDGIVNASGGGTYRLKADIDWYYGRIHNNKTDGELTIEGTVKVYAPGSHYFGGASTSYIDMAADLSSDDSDVSIALGHQFSNSLTFEQINDSEPHGRFCLTGDNSGYRGKFTVRDSQTRKPLFLGGKEPLGDPDTPNSKALTVDSNKSLVFVMASDCEQSSTRGLYFNSVAENYFGAWKGGHEGHTLSYPITSGTASSVGKFIKVGDGTFRYNGAYSAHGWIAVSNGTFSVGKDATFPSKQKFIVGAGATLNIEPGAMVELADAEITLVDEKTSKVTYDFQPLTVACDGTDVTPVTLDDGRVTGHLQAFALSQPFDLPVRTQRRVAVFTIPAGGLQLSDFRDETPVPASGLPRTSLDLVTEEAGAQTLYIVVESAIVDPLVVPFDGTNATPVTVTEAWSGCALPFTLSQPFTLPILTTNEVAVLRIPGGGKTLDDFRDETPKTAFELPTTWLKLDEDGADQVLYVVAKPALASAGGARWADAFNKEVPTWSDSLKLHSGADYYYCAGFGCVSSTPRTTGGSNSGSEFKFAGDSFTFADNLTINVYNSGLYFADFRTYPNCKLYLCNASNNEKPVVRGVRGNWFVGGDRSTWGSPSICISGDYVTNVNITATLTGEGALTYRSTSSTNGVDCPVVLRLWGDNSKFKGALRFEERSAKWSFVEVSVTNALAFGGPLDAFAEDAVALARESGATVADQTRRMVFRPDVSMTVDAANRGWKFGYGCGIRTPKGVVFTFAPPRLTASAEILKSGEGALVLGYGELVAGSNAKLTVADGSVGQSKAGILAEFPVTFAGGGVCVDAAHPVEGGFAPKSVELEEGTPAVIPVSFVNLPAEKQAQHFTVMTVPAGSPELTLVPARCKGYVVTLASETDGNGNTVWSADLEPAGALIYLK